MYAEVQNYRQFLSNLPNKIKKSSFKASGIIKKTGIPKASFYQKMKNNSFTLIEVEKISHLLYLEEELDQRLAAGLEDIKKGRVHSEKEVLEDLNLSLKK